MMRRLKAFSIFLAVLLIPLVAFPTGPDWVAVKEIRFTIPYHRLTDFKYQAGNLILREMAKQVLREPWLVNIRVDLNMELRISRSPGTDSLEICFSRLRVTGDTTFRDFGIADVLVPSHADLKLHWANRADTTGFRAQIVRGYPLSARDSARPQIHAGLFDPEVDTLIVEEVELYYDSAALGVFSERLQLIHNYHASLRILDTIQQAASGIDLTRHEDFLLNYFKIIEINKALELIASFRFGHTLLDRSTDHGQLLSRYQNVYRVARSLTFNFIDEIKKTGTIAWSGDIKQPARFFTSLVMAWVTRTHLMDNQQGTIYRDYLDHYFDHAYFPEDDQIPGLLLRKLFPDASFDTLARYVAGTLYFSMKQKGEELIIRKQYTDAFTLLGFAEEFRKVSSLAEPQLTDQRLRQQAAEGVFNSFVGIAEGCLRTGKTDMADLYLERADDYRKRNSSWVLDDSSYKAIYSALFFLRNAECDRMLDQKQFREALDCYDLFEDRYSGKELAVVRAQLDQKKNLARIGLYAETTRQTEMALRTKSADSALIYDERAVALRRMIRNPGNIFRDQDAMAPELAILRYQRTMADGTAALDKRQFNLALSLLRTARGLSIQYAIQPDPDYDSLFRRAMKNYLLIQLSVSQKMIWNNRFDSAVAARNLVVRTAEENGLGQDEDLRNFTGRFDRKIAEQKCRNLQEAIDLEMIRADRSIAVKKYPDALAYFNKALDLSRSDSGCGFNHRAISDSLNGYQPAGLYQVNQAAIATAVIMGDYEKALQLFEKNEDDYMSLNLGRFGLQAEPLVDFVAEKNNPAFSEYAARVLHERGLHKESLYLLKMTGSQLAKTKPLEELQKSLARSLASADAGRNTGETADQALRAYDVNEPFFEFFRAAYRKEFQKSK